MSGLGKLMPAAATAFASARLKAYKAPSDRPQCNQWWMLLWLGRGVVGGSSTSKGCNVRELSFLLHRHQVSARQQSTAAEACICGLRMSKCCRWRCMEALTSMKVSGVFYQNMYIGPGAAHWLGDDDLQGQASGQG